MQENQVFFQRRLWGRAGEWNRLRYSLDWHKEEGFFFSARDLSHQTTFASYKSHHGPRVIAAVWQQRARLRDGGKRYRESRLRPDGCANNLSSRPAAPTLRFLRFP